MWRLLFEGQIIQEGVGEYMIPEYLCYDSAKEDENTWVDISEFVERRINAGAKYVIQFGPGWKSYKPNLSETEVKQLKESVREAERMKNGKTIEELRYDKGQPESTGK